MGDSMVPKNKQVLWPECVGLLVGGLLRMNEAVVCINCGVDHV